jgi:hypothetical protein
MADIADIADKAVEYNLLDSISQSRRATPNIPFKSSCYYCGKRVTIDRRWCNAQCRDKWQDEQ